MLHHELKAAAEHRGARFLERTPEGPLAYNPYAQGSDTEIADKALSGETFTEPHYLRRAQRYLGHAIRVMHTAGVSTAEAQRAVDAMIEVASDELARGGDVTLAGFGKFSVSHRAARLGRNPSTGERIEISHSKSAKFTAARALKNAVAEEGPLPGDPDEEY